MTRHGELIIIVVEFIDIIEIAVPLHSGLWNIVEFRIPVVIRLSHVVIFVEQSPNPVEVSFFVYKF